MKSQTLQETSATVYLGLTLTSNLTWSNHISGMTTKANRVLNFLKRNLKKCPPSLKEKAYTTYVRPIMEYGSTVWDNNVHKNVNEIEKVQRRAARFVSNNYQNRASVSDMIQTLGWNTLQERRTYTNLVMFYKISYHLVAIPQSFLPPLLCTGHFSRYNHTLAYLIPYSRIEAYKQSFVPRTVTLWNTLPSEIVYADTLDVYKNRLSSFMF